MARAQSTAANWTDTEGTFARGAPSIQINGPAIYPNALPPNITPSSSPGYLTPALSGVQHGQKMGKRGGNWGKWGKTSPGALTYSHTWPNEGKTIDRIGIVAQTAVCSGTVSRQEHPTARPENSQVS